ETCTRVMGTNLSHTPRCMGPGFLDAPSPVSMRLYVICRGALALGLAARIGDGGEGPGLRDPGLYGLEEDGIEALVVLALAQPEIDGGIRVWSLRRNDIHAAQALRLVQAHHRVSERPADLELFLMPAKVDQILLEGQRRFGPSAAKDVLPLQMLQA